MTHPIFFVDGTVDNNGIAEEVYSTLKIPSLAARQGMNAQDPVASVHHYLICICVLLPATLGKRMCLHCPHCNVDDVDPDNKAPVDPESNSPCHDLLGKNSKPIGGYGVICEAMALATEFQEDGTPHGHGFIYLVNIYH